MFRTFLPLKISEVRLKSPDGSILVLTAVLITVTALRLAGRKEKRVAAASNSPKWRTRIVFTSWGIDREADAPR